MRRDRLLVVDDSAANRMVATGHLEAAGYEVVAASTGEQALALLARERFDLVVLDVMMPGFGGYETCRRMRADPALATLPVLFMTALGERDIAAAARDAGGDDVLGKPFHRARLLDRVGALIASHRHGCEG